MISLPEQFGYKSPKSIDGIEEFYGFLDMKPYSKTIQKGKNPIDCFKIHYNGNETNPYRFETSYFVGVDWVIERLLPIYVSPKLDNNVSEVDYLKMLFDALEAPENYNHLDQL